MNKGELIERIAKEAGATEGEAQEYFGAFERVVTEALAPDVVHLPQHTPTGSASPNPLITRRWQGVLAPV